MRVAIIAAIASLLASPALAQDTDPLAWFNGRWCTETVKPEQIGDRRLAASRSGPIRL